MQITFKNVRREGSVIVAECNHNCGEHKFMIRIEGVVSSEQLEGLKLITDPPEYAEELYAVKGATSLLDRVLETKQDYIAETGFIYSMG